MVVAPPSATTSRVVPTPKGRGDVQFTSFVAGPHAAIEAFRLAKAEEPELQLVLAGLLDPGAAEDWRAAKEVSDYAAGEADLLLLTQLEAGGGRLEPRPIDLRELAGDIGAAARALGPDRRIDAHRERGQREVGRSVGEPDGGVVPGRGARRSRAGAAHRRGDQG